MYVLNACVSGETGVLVAMRKERCGRKKAYHGDRIAGLS
jgi:hypothetical protein